MKITGTASWVLNTPGRTITLLILLFAVALVQRWSLDINNDVAWYLHSATAMLEGGQLYRDIFVEVNPPLILYLTLPPAAAARWLGVFPVPVFVIYVFALCALSLALSWSVMGHLRGIPVAMRRGLLVAMAIVLVVLPAADFGQREHLTVLLSLPYLLLAAVRALSLACPRSLALPLGAMAALGFCIKPYFLLLPIAIELFLWLRHRSLRGMFRPEILSLATTGLLYAASLPLLTPDYLTTVVPMVLELYNGAIRNDLATVLDRQPVWLIPAAPLLFLRSRHAAAFRTPEAISLLAIGCFLVIYLLQMKGWFYQLYPVSGFLFLTLAWHLAGALSETGEQGAASDGAQLSGIKRLLAWMLLLALLLPPLLQPGRQSAILAHIGDTVRQHAEGGPIFFFSSTTWTTFPLVTYTGVTMKSRFSHLWTLPGLERRRKTLGPEAGPEDLARLDEVERFTKDAVIADLMGTPPTLILVDTRPEKPWFSDPFDYIDFFSEDPRFADFWTQYQQIADFSGFLVYRRCAQACGAFTPG